MSALQLAELPPGDTFTGTVHDLRAGDYVKASVHGYSLVEYVSGTHIRFASGGSESGYTFTRSIHRPHNPSLAQRSSHGRMLRNADIAAQVAVEAVLEDPTAYDSDTVEAVRANGIRHKVHSLYLEMLPAEEFLETEEYPGVPADLDARHP
jgi:hypothetical protein